LLSPTDRLLAQDTEVRRIAAILESAPDVIRPGWKDARVAPAVAAARAGTRAVCASVRSPVDAAMDRQSTPLARPAWD